MIRPSFFPDTIAIYRSALKLTEDRLAAKIASPVDVDRAQTQLSSAEAQLSDLTLNRATLENSIAALVGKAAASFSVSRSSRRLSAPRPPRAVPADVLRNRPDVAESERLTAAASELIGASRANFFPKVALLALGGTQDTNFRLFNPQNLFRPATPRSVACPGVARSAKPPGRQRAHRLQAVKGSAFARRPSEDARPCRDAASPICLVSQGESGPPYSTVAVHVPAALSTTTPILLPATPMGISSSSRLESALAPPAQDTRATCEVRRHDGRPLLGTPLGGKWPGGERHGNGHQDKGKQGTCGSSDRAQQQHSGHKTGSHRR